MSLQYATLVTSVVAFYTLYGCPTVLYTIVCNSSCKYMHMHHARSVSAADTAVAQAQAVLAAERLNAVGQCSGGAAAAADTVQKQFDSSGVKGNKKQSTSVNESSALIMIADKSCVRVLEAAVLSHYAACLSLRRLKRTRTRSVRTNYPARRTKIRRISRYISAILWQLQLSSLASSSNLQPPPAGQLIQHGIESIRAPFNFNLQV